MRRRSFLKAGGIALGTGLAANSLLAKIPPHNFDKYDFGGGPPVSETGIEQKSSERLQEPV